MGYSVDAVTAEMRRRRPISMESLSFDGWLCQMRRVIRALDAYEEYRQCSLCEPRTLLDTNEYAAQSFRRKHTAKRRSLKKAQLRRACRKFNGKSDDKRVERKLKKFAPSFRSL